MLPICERTTSNSSSSLSAVCDTKHPVSLHCFRKQDHTCIVHHRSGVAEGMNDDMPAARIIKRSVTIVMMEALCVGVVWHH